MEVETISAARLFLANKRPYLSTPLWSLSPVPMDKEVMPTMAVDKFWRLYYNKDLDWDVPTTASVLYHEIQHLIRAHMERGEGLKGDTWNIAGDAEINDDIISESLWNLPDFAVTPTKIESVDGKMAEFYYEHILKNQDKLNIPQADPDNPNPTGGNCGSGAGGHKRPWEKDDIPGSRKISKGEGQLISRKVAEDIRRVKNRGDVPGYWERWAEDFLNPQVPWEKELRAHIQNSVYEVIGRVNYSYRRPGRRSSALPDFVMPSMTKPTITAAVVIDTSGSMGGDDLAKAVAEVGGILKALGIQSGVTCIAVDAAVHVSQKVFSKSQVKLGGGGGTDMRVGIEAAMELRPKPDVVVVLTDGYTPWPDTAPKSKVIIGVIGGPMDGCPEWARVVEIQ